MQPQPRAVRPPCRAALAGQRAAAWLGGFAATADHGGRLTRKPSKPGFNVDQRALANLDRVQTALGEQVIYLRAAEPRCLAECVDLRVFHSSASLFTVGR
jgi:hypothetical protein